MHVIIQPNLHTAMVARHHMQYDEIYFGLLWKMVFFWLDQKSVNSCEAVRWVEVVGCAVVDEKRRPLMLQMERQVR
jgi:hypothetical protein